MYDNKKALLITSKLQHMEASRSMAERMNRKKSLFSSRVIMSTEK